MRTLVLLALMGCAPTRYSATAVLQFYPTTRPVPEVYTTSVPVQAKGCEPRANVPNLIRRATGDYDALVEVVIQRIDSVAVLGDEVAAADACWQVTGVGVFFGKVNPDDELVRRRREGLQ